MKKGQEEAPIELLLAVTILTFVIILGFYTYQSLCGAQYEQKLKASFHKFATELENVYKSGIGSSTPVVVDFSEIGCPAKIQAIRLIQGIKSQCLSSVGKSDCLELVAPIVERSSTTPSFLISETVDIPSTTTVQLIGASSECEHTDLNKHDGSKDIIFTDSTYTSCGWGAREYTFRITKESSSKIIIEEA
jgi:hypothetical protein